MGGLMNLGRGTANTAMQGLGVGHESEYKRNSAQKQLDQAADTAKKSTMGNMAGMGAKFAMSDKGGEFIANTFGKGGSHDVANAMGTSMDLGLGTAAAAEGSSAAIATGAQGAADAAYMAAVDGGASEAAAMAASEAALAEGAAGTAAAAEAGMMAGVPGAMVGLAAGYLLTELF